MVELEYLGYGGTTISRIWWNYVICDMVELGYQGYGELGYLCYGGTRISMLWWNWDIYAMVELEYLG